MDSSIQSADQPPDLTDRITRTSKYSTAGGGFGDIWECLLHTGANQVMVAVKVIRPQADEVDEKALRRELGMWKRVHHANILPLLGIARDFGVYISMVSPWLEKGSLTMYLRAHKDLGLSDRHRLLQDITSGLHYLHGISMVHGDLTPNNVLLNNENRAVLTDFGLSSMLLGQGYTYLQRSHAQLGAIRYTAPELLDPDAFVPPDTRSDVYSFGCLALYVLSGHEPWADAKNKTSIIFSIAAGGTPQRPASSQISDAHWHLIRQCFSRLDASPPRPTTDEILTFLEKLQLEAVLETQFSGQSDNPAPPSDKKGKKRAIAGSDVESTPPWKRTHPGPIQESLNSTRIKEPNVENTPLLRRAHPWPIQESMYSTQVKSDGDAGVKEIVFSSDGERMAIACCDQTIRIWSVPNRIETARLAQAISSIAWMANDNAVITLGQDGIIGTWTQQDHHNWQWAELLGKGKKEPATCFAYKPDCLVVAFPRSNVQVWQLIEGTWQLLSLKPSISQRDVTCMKFIDGGDALLGGTSNGKLWYRRLPDVKFQNSADPKAKIRPPKARLQNIADFKANIQGLDVSVEGSVIFLPPYGNRERLIGFLGMCRKGKTEQVDATNGDSTNDVKQTSPALVISSHFCVVFHGSDCLIWDNMTGSVIHCLHHGENEKPQAVAGFGHSCIVTGTAQGLLSWWNPPIRKTPQHPLGALTQNG